MIEFKEATIKNIYDIQNIALNTWPKTFNKIMPDDQITYMLKLMYSYESIQNQMLSLNHKFILILLKGKIVGFTSYELHFHNTDQLMIHKAYILPDAQGYGLGKKLFNHLTHLGLKNNQTEIRLKVFIKNYKAIMFYKKNGYINNGIEVSDIGNNYIVQDYVMTKRIIIQDTDI